MTDRAPFRFFDLIVAVLAAGLIAHALANLAAAEAGVTREPLTLGGAPAAVYRPAEPPSEPAPVVVIAHGFAGSQQLMESFALTLARAGLVAVSYDALGHGRNPAPLTGDVTKEEGATRALLAEMAAVASEARALPGVDGRLALLGHSMASDIVIRAAQADPEIAATVAVSMFSQTVDGATPANLLIVTGAWERFLSAEALRVVGLAHGQNGVFGANANPIEEAVTYGRFADGSARRAAFADGAEHIGVLYSAESLTEAAEWLRRAFDLAPAPPVEPAVRGMAILQLFGALALLAWPLSRLLPAVARAPLGAELSPGARLWIALAPAIVTPLLLWRAPIDLLPVAVADYLAAHFLVYGLITAGGLALAGGFRRDEPRAESARSWAAFAIALVAFLGLYLGVFGWALDRYFTSFAPTETRALVILAMLLGTLPYFLADLWTTRGPNAPWWAVPLTKACFLVSLAAAVALDLERLFFLIIILPLILAFFILFGFLNGWVRRATGDPAVAAAGSAVAFAWSLAVTFPVLAS